MRINREALELTSEQLRSIQLVELENLIELDRICRENKINTVVLKLLCILYP